MEIAVVEFIKRTWKNLPFNRARKKKNSIRELAAQRRRVMSKEQVEEYSQQIISQLEQQRAFQEAKVILFYYPISNEVNVRPLLEKYKDEKTILLPVAHQKSIEMRPYTGREGLHRGRYGIPEPKHGTYKGKPDLVIVPGVAFDKKCNRLGRGKGYYDRFLNKLKDVKTIGLAYDKQVVEEIPTTYWDVRLDCVITQTEIYTKK